MGYLDNTQVIVDAVLTKRGRELLARNDPSSNILVLEYGWYEVMDNILVKTPIYHPFLLGGPYF